MQKTTLETSAQHIPHLSPPNNPNNPDSFAFNPPPLRVLHLFVLEVQSREDLRLVAVPAQALQIRHEGLAVHQAVVA